MVIYDHLGDLVKNNLIADLIPEENVKRAVFNINIGDRWIINKVHKNQDKFIWRVLATEMDNHADTHCFGANFRPISFTLEECTMFPLLPEYAEQMNLPIFTGVTALKLYSGEVVILEFGQGLWFGNRIEKLLTNPNQFQKFGIQICNDPTNPHRNLVIESSEYLLIPITMEVSTCGLVTHPPTENYLH